MTTTKIVQVNLSALTRVHYTEALEVPADMTEAELQSLLNDRFQEMDWENYQFAYPEFWEKSDCSIAPATGPVEVTGQVTRTADWTPEAFRVRSTEVDSSPSP